MKWHPTWWSQSVRQLHSQVGWDRTGPSHSELLKISIGWQKCAFSENITKHCEGEVSDEDAWYLFPLMLEENWCLNGNTFNYLFEAGFWAHCWEQKWTRFWWISASFSHRVFVTASQVRVEQQNVNDEKMPGNQGVRQYKPSSQFILLWSLFVLFVLTNWSGWSGKLQN